MSTKTAFSNRLDLISNLTADRFGHFDSVVLLDYPQQPIITNYRLPAKFAKIYKTQPIYQRPQDFLAAYLVDNGNSLDQLSQKLGFKDPQQAFVKGSQMLQQHNLSAALNLLAGSFGATDLHDVVKIATLTSATDLTDIIKIYQLVKQKNQMVLTKPNGLLFYIGYIAGIDQPYSFQQALTKIKQA